MTQKIWTENNINIIETKKYKPKKIDKTQEKKLKWKEISKVEQKVKT